MARPRTLALAAVGAAMVLGAVASAPMSRETATARAENAEAVRRGAHCLNWEGAHRAVVGEVRGRLWSPVSFEHVETQVMTDMGSGTHRLFMKYRSRGHSGRLATAYAEAAFDNRTCRAWGVRLLR